MYEGFGVILTITPNGYIVPMEFRVHLFPRISAFSRRTKMHLNGMFLIGTEFFQSLGKIDIFSTFCNTGVSTTVTAIPQGYRHKQWPLK